MKSVGELGEDLACQFLKNKKWRILARNQTIPAGEIDIVAREKSGILVFVEVKTLSGDGGVFTPEQHFNEEKRWRVRRLAENFVNRYPSYTDDKLGYRVDLLAITIKDPLSKNWQQETDIRHYENL
jgi:putative endonuclease